MGRIGNGWGATPDAALTNNYALADMRLESSSNYETYYFPFWDGSSPEPDPPVYYRFSNSTNAADKDGSSVAASAFKTASFWTGTLGFDTSIWNMNGVGRGYPMLAGMGDSNKKPPAFCNGA